MKIDIPLEMADEIVVESLKDSARLLSKDIRLLWSKDTLCRYQVEDLMHNIYTLDSTMGVLEFYMCATDFEEFSDEIENTFEEEYITEEDLEPEEEDKNETVQESGSIDSDPFVNNDDRINAILEQIFGPSSTEKASGTFHTF